MTLTGSLQRSSLFVVALFLIIWPRLLFSAGSRELPRLRSGNPVIVRSIAKADQQSLTFHGLLESISRAVPGRDELKLAARASDSVVANGFR